MKRFLLCGVLTLCLLMSSAVRGEESRDAKVKAEMIENYLLIQEAWKLRDADRMISFESPDFTDVGDDGTVITKEGSDALWRDTMKSIQKIYEVRVEIKNLTIEPNRVVILSNLFLDADMQEPSDEMYRINSTLQSRDTWVLYDRVWMLKRSETVSAKVLIDGKLQE